MGRGREPGKDAEKGLPGWQEGAGGEATWGREREGWARGQCDRTGREAEDLRVWSPLTAWRLWVPGMGSVSERNGRTETRLGWFEAGWRKENMEPCYGDQHVQNFHYSGKRKK